jgi:CubicO group peptidase (beta-lactamase class C family)
MKLDACMNWSGCSDDAIARAVVLMQDGKAVRDDLRGRRPDCPVVAAADGSCDLGRWRAGDNGSLFSPQGGLRISARDLARVGRMLLNRGTIDGLRILAPESVDAMIGPAWRFNGRNGSQDGESEAICAYGLAVHHLALRMSGCRDDPGLPPGDWSGHSGDAYGLRSGLWIDRARGVGIAYFVTGLPTTAPRGKSAFTAAEEKMVERSVSLLQHRP